jgi:hypothetical protein
MNVIFSLVASIGLGFFIRQRATAVFAYLIIDTFVFTFQTLSVLLTWMAAKDGAGGAKAFGPFPTGFPVAYKQSEVFAYGLVNLVIILAGVGLTIGTHRVAAKRTAAKAGVSVG